MEQNPNPYPQQYQPSDNRSVGKRVFKGCAISAAIVALVIIGILIYSLQMPEIKVIRLCMANMVEIKGALQRYNAVNGDYPDNLGQLKPKFLQDPSILNRPPLKRNHSEYSYIYRKPGPDAKGSFVILECDPYKMNPNVPPIRLLMPKDGNIRAVPVEPIKKENSKAK